MKQYTRFRYGSDVYYPDKRFYYDEPANPSQSWATGNWATGYRLRSMNDVVTADFARLMAAGVVINNPVAYWTHEDKLPGGGYFHRIDKIDGHVSTFSGMLTQHYLGLGGAPNSLTIPLQNEEDFDKIGYLTAVTRQRALAAVDPTPYAFGEDIGEIGETIRFIKSPLKSLNKLAYRYTRAVNKNGRTFRRKFSRNHRGQLPGAIEMAQVASDVWLEYRFAAAPLVRSVYSAALALGHENTAQLDRRVARDRQAVNPRDRIESYYATESPTRIIEYEIRTQRSSKVSSGILYEVSNPIRDFRRTLGIRLVDIPETAWQLVPLSFMVDRLIDVSSMIRGLSVLANPDISILAGWTSSHVMGSTRSRVKAMHDTDASSLSGYGDVITKSRGSYHRDPWQPSVSDTLPVPQWDGLVKDLTNIADLATILGGRLAPYVKGKWDLR